MEEALDGPPPCQSLHEAVAKLDKRSVAWFLQRQGDSVMQRDDDMRTPLLLAAAAGDCTTCTLLIRRMAAYDADSINWPDASGLTPLHWACTQQRVDAVALLLHHAAAVTQQGQSSRLGSARGLLPHLLRERLTALGGSRHPRREAGPMGAQLLPGCSRQSPPKPRPFHHRRWPCR